MLKWARVSPARIKNISPKPALYYPGQNRTAYLWYLGFIRVNFFCSKQRNIVVSIFLLTISETRKRNQSTNRCSTASLRIPIRALDSDLVRPHQALLLLVLDRFQQTLEIDFEELRRVCSSSFVLGLLKSISRVIIIYKSCDLSVYCRVLRRINPF